MMYDVIIIGGGIAGLMAAIEAKTDNNRVAIITKGNIFKSNSALASGGINATLDPNNHQSIKRHIKDTLNGAYGLGDKQAISYMCERAPHIIKKLIDLGVEFDRDEQGRILQRSFGGTRSKRTCFIGDKTGAQIIQTLIKTAQNKGIKFLVNNFVMNLTTLKHKVSGVVAIRRFDSSVVVYPAKSVILAGGGYAGIYRGYSTNAQDYTGDLLAVALRLGLHLQDMEFVQFHPTGFVKTNYLVSEAARGEGGYLVNSDGKRFVDELGPRDVVSRAIMNQIENRKDVFLDLRHLSRDIIETKLPSLYKTAYMQAGIDISQELLPIKPVAHYTMGGIETDIVYTDIDGLFTCGECASNGVHGANRLGGNSLLEGAVFGEMAGKKALEYSQTKEFLPIEYNNVIKDIQLVDHIFSSDTTKNFNAMRISLGKVMFENVGIKRDEQSLIKAYDYISYLRSEVPTLHCVSKERSNNVELISILELRNALEIAEAVILCALKRRESRGSHYRVDFPLSDESEQQNIVVKELGKGQLRVWFKENPLLYKIRKWFSNH
ncbi:MAG: FAD-dependent oxidoreductase [Sulfurovaceae bacterium]|nr:FAD-dependent oxidoreductase [Sulfurovaceae bacterium]